MKPIAHGGEAIVLRALGDEVVPVPASACAPPERGRQRTPVMKTRATRPRGPGQVPVAGAAEYCSSVTCSPQLTGLPLSSFCCMAV